MTREAILARLREAVDPLTEEIRLLRLELIHAYQVIHELKCKDATSLFHRRDGTMCTACGAYWPGEFLPLAKTEG